MKSWVAFCTFRVSLTSINFQNIFITPSKTLPHSAVSLCPASQPQEATALSISPDVPVSDVSCTWNQTPRGFSRLAPFAQHHLFTAPACGAAESGAPLPPGRGGRCSPAPGTHPVHLCAARGPTPLPLYGSCQPRCRESESAFWSNMCFQSSRLERNGCVNSVTASDTS